MLVYLVLLLFTIKNTSSANSLSNLYYNTTSGLYRAKIININSSFVHQIKGIHYAEQPGRFQRPVMRSYAKHVIHDEREALACYQQLNYTSYGDFELLTIPKMTEDCLTINVYIPIEANEENNEPYAVMMVIHGGSNVVGNAELFDGSVLAAHGKIVVAAINYRLGLYGFLSSRTQKFSGNYGIHDQILAIKWLRLNCAVLNCDPHRITLWGHSAGAGDTMWLALSKKSNGLFKRAIIQSGSALSYWGLDMHPEQRYKGLRSFFNCTNHPLENDLENRNLEVLIEDCLTHVTPSALNEFRFGLLDWPGVVIDSDLIDVQYSPTELIANALDVDIMTSINTIEGYDFSIYFNGTISFWIHHNVTNGAAITLERYAMLSRDKCFKNFAFQNRALVDKFYDDYITKLFSSSTNSYSIKSIKERLKLAFINSAMIFDLGFIEFVKKLSHAKQNELNRTRSGKLYVYEYFYENLRTDSIYGHYKHLTRDFKFNSHFDSMDYIFGLPIASKLYLTQQTTEHTLPFDNFNLNLTYNQQDLEFSRIFMDYIANFVKSGDPNEGAYVRHTWHEYGQGSKYFIFDEHLLQNDKKRENAGIRDELYNFWFEKLKFHSNCNVQQTGTLISEETQKYKNCQLKLQDVHEYREIDENFLQMYDQCFDSEKNMPSLKSSVHMSTFCLDVMVVSRLLIEHRTCCHPYRGLKPSQRNVTSTLCDMNFNLNYVNYTVFELIKNFGDEALADLIVSLGNSKKSNSNADVINTSKASFRNSQIILILLELVLVLLFAILT